jgi:hypothetical protein
MHFEGYYAKTALVGESPKYLAKRNPSDAWRLYAKTALVGESHIVLYIDDGGQNKRIPHLS